MFDAQDNSAGRAAKPTGSKPRNGGGGGGEGGGRSNLPNWDGVLALPQSAPAAADRVTFTPPAPTEAGSVVASQGLSSLTSWARPDPALATLQKQHEPVASRAEPGPVGLAGPKLHEAVSAPTVPTAEPAPHARRTYRMSWEDYQKLSPDQRAAVDFNTMLVQARNKDLKSDYGSRSGEQQSAYDKAVTEMFGSAPTSDTYAPETLTVLRQIDYHAKPGETLDDFLNLDVAIGKNDLKGFAIGGPDSVKPKGGNINIDALDSIKERLAESTSVLQRQMALSRSLTSDFFGTAATARNTDLEQFGGLANTAKPQLGYGTTSKDRYFQQVVELLSRAKTDEGTIQQVWNDVAQRLTRPADQQALLAYADSRARQAASTQRPLGDAPKVDYRSPEEFLALFGQKAGG